VKWEHFRAFLWLRWRIQVNQLKRGGIANVVILALLAPFIAIFVIALLIGAFVVGLLVLPQADSAVILLVFDGVILMFLFFWALTLVVELQRSEVLSLNKFLHLPVSIKGVFLINYLSSLVSLNLMSFVPAMVGLSIGMAFGKGPIMLLLLPLVASFVLMVTALTYQFQGWLAAIMVNQRRRRTVIVLITMTFVLMCQLPNLFNIFQPWKKTGLDERFVLKVNEEQELLRLRNTKQITQEEYGQRFSEVQRKFQEDHDNSEKETLKQLAQIGWVVNLAVPPGWLALGAEAATEGNVLPGILGTLGMTLIGLASLGRSYRTTVRIYTGEYSNRKTKKTVAAPAPVPVGPQPVGLLERDIPGLSEQPAAIALAGFRSLLRAPEAKMLLLTPLLMVIIFGSIFIASFREAVPEFSRPLMVFAGMSMVLLGMFQLLGNQFGFDRSGFRVFVLCAARRRDILLGKNLAFVPLVFALGALTVTVIEIVYPMRVDHLLASLPRMVSMYLLFCLVANCMSILAPTPIAAGSLKPANPKLLTVILQLLFVSLMGMLLVPLLLPLGIEFTLDELELVQGVPIDLILSLLICWGMVAFYRLALGWQGDLLQAREQKILEAVTTKAE
jgi:ABC-2 type transport system permease protein